MSGVFISYAHQDKQRLRPLVKALEQVGLNVFWDRNIPIGQSWHDVITQALASAQCVIVAWSKDSANASFVREEAEEGKQRGVLLPVLLDSNVRIPLGFRDLQAADLTDLREGSPSAELDGLLKVVDSVIRSSSEQATAADWEQNTALLEPPKLPLVQRVEIGEVAFPNENPEARQFYDGVTLGPREISVPVKFASSFVRPPRIIVSLQKIELGDLRANIHRISVSAQNVVETGFDLYFQTWAESQIYDAVASWTAIGV